MPVEALLGSACELLGRDISEGTVDELVAAGDLVRCGRWVYRKVTAELEAELAERVSELLATQGVAATSRSMPAWAGSALARAGEAAWKALPLPGRPPLTRFTYWVTSQECTIRIDKAREQLGYAPVKSIADGLAELAAA